jgi:hypothetical protein
MTKLPLVVEFVLPPQPVYIPCPTELEIQAYLRDAFPKINWPKAEEERLEPFIANVANQISSNLADSMKFQPHGECTLLRHHCMSNQSSQPHIHFGVTKSSCLQCALVFGGYKKYAEKHAKPRYRTTYNLGIAGTPCLLPEFTDEIDLVLKEHMLHLIKELIGDLLAQLWRVLQKELFFDFERAHAGGFSPRA